jgi:hypothetical protein
MCGKTGDAMQFSNGCPFCGYADEKTKPAGYPAATVKHEDPLPVWLYVVCGGALIGLLSAFILTGLH